MTLLEVKNVLQAKLLTANVDLSNNVLSVCASDLMSDVLAFHANNTLLLTGLINQQTLRTVEIADVTGIVVVRGKQPDPLVINDANLKKIPLMTTQLCMYDACGLLYINGLRGVTEQVKSFHRKND